MNNCYYCGIELNINYPEHERKQIGQVEISIAANIESGVTAKIERYRFCSVECAVKCLQTEALLSKDRGQS